MIGIDFLSVIIAAVAAMALGFVWYSPKLGFGKQWMKWSGIPMDTPPPKNAGRMMFFGLVSQIVMAYVLANFLILAKVASLSDGLTIALWLWIGFIATIQLGSVLWEQRPFKLWLLNSVYWLLSLLIMAAILV